MTTFAELIDDCIVHLQGFGDTRDKVTSLTQTLNSTDVSFTVADARQINRGYVEIDSELLAVKSVDVATNTVTLHPWGRGVRGTTAVTHANNAMATDTPEYPRNRVATEIKSVISGLYPQLFAVSTDETQTVSASKMTYQLPADCESIVRVQYRTTGPSGVWAPVTRYRVDYNADVSAFPTGKSVDLIGGMQPGRTIKIVYRRQFGTFTSESDTLASIFVDEGWRDIIRMQALARLLMAQDPSRLDLASVESTQRAQFTQPASATQTARGFLALAEQRLAQERRQLLMQYPTTQVRTT